MAVVATGCRHTRNTNYIIAVACFIFGIWYFYDGWFGKEFQDKHTREDGTPDATLQMNRYWVPIGGTVAAAFFVALALRMKTRKIIALEDGLELSDGLKLPYDDIKQIDKRFFEKEGHFTLEYEVGGEVKKLKLTDRTYDKLGLLLDEIIRRTGAAPAETDSAKDEESKTEDA